MLTLNSIRMKKKSVVIAMLLSAVLLAGCSGKHDHHDHEEAAAATDASTEHASGSNASAEATKPQFDVVTDFQTQLSGVFAAYVSLKEAFVASNAADVKAKAATMREALGKVDMKLLEGAAHHDWMNYLGGMETALKTIQEAADIEAQRKAFSDLSDSFYKSIKAYGLGGITAYYEYCPMAFNNEGAYWLSDSEKIRNPYFGDKMLGCGSVEEKLN